MKSQHRAHYSGLAPPAKILDLLLQITYGEKHTYCFRVMRNKPGHLLLQSYQILTELQAIPTLFR